MIADPIERRENKRDLYECPCCRHDLFRILRNPDEVECIYCRNKEIAEDIIKWWESE